MREALLRAVVVSAVLLRALPAPAATYTVNSTLDQPDADTGDNVCASFPALACTLRAAVMQANSHAGPDVILVPAGTYVLTRVGSDTIGSVGDLDVTGDLTIQAVGGPVVIDANGAITSDRAFKLLSGSLTLVGITIIGGNTPGSGGAILAQGSSSLTLSNVTISGNTAGNGGGGIFATCVSVQITSSVVQGNVNVGPLGGGGAFVGFGDVSPPVLTVSNSSFLNNTSLGSGVGGMTGGGLIADEASVSVSGSTFRGNKAYQGGGLVYFSSAGCQLPSFENCSLTVTTSLFEGNIALGLGGGVDLESPSSVTNSRIIANSAGSGGGVSASSAGATLTDVEVSHNTAQFSGGGIYATGLTVIRGWIDGNTATAGPGGGIYLPNVGGSVTLTDTNVLSNTASGDGGGVWVGKSFSARASAIYGNHAGRGGGVFVSGTLGTALFDDGTISGNGAGTYGGGIYADANSTVKVSSATIVGNGAGQTSPGGGGGVYVVSPASVTATNTVFSFNSGGGKSGTSDCQGNLVSGGYDFMTSGVGCTITGVATGNQIGSLHFPINPLLGPLQWLGPAGTPAQPAAPTPAHVPAANSPLVNAGAVGGCTDSNGVLLTSDQIGQSRSVAGRCDIGAVEAGAVAPPAMFYPLPPCRLFDTRNASGADAAAPVLGGLETRNFGLLSRCSVPSAARAVSVNVTITGPGTGGYLTLFPADLGTVPGTNNISFDPGQTRANNAMLGLAANGSGFYVTNSSPATVHFILDVNGYFR